MSKNKPSLKDQTDISEKPKSLNKARIIKKSQIRIRGPSSNKDGRGTISSVRNHSKILKFNKLINTSL